MKRQHSKGTIKFIPTYSGSQIVSATERSHNRIYCREWVNAASTENIPPNDSFLQNNISSFNLMDVTSVSQNLPKYTAQEDTVKFVSKKKAKSKSDKKKYLIEDT